MANDLAQRAPDYIRAIAPYQGGRPIGEIARRFGFREDQIVKLASNENPLGMSPKARQAMLEASQDLGRYPDGNGFEHTGDSMIIGPKGEILEQLPAGQEGILQHVLDMENLANFRNQFPAGNDADDFSIL